MDAKWIALWATCAACAAAEPEKAPEAEAKTDSVMVGDSLRTFRLGEILVVGNRGSNLSRVDPTGATRADPRRDAAHAAAELPGVVLSKVGPRNEAQLWVRGFDSRQTGLYLDGVPIYVPYDGNVDLARFSTSELSAITVEKGASSLALGPNSMGGAVNLVSTVPRKPLELSGELAQIGPNGEQGAARIGTRLGNWYALGSVSARGTGGLAMSGDFTPTRYEDGGERNNSRSFDRTLHALAGWTGDGGADVAISVVDQHGTKGVPVYAGADTTSSRFRFWKWPYWDKTSVYELSKVPVGAGIWVELPLYLDRFSNSLYAFDDASYSTQKKKSSFRSWYDDWTAGGSLRLGWANGGDTAKVFGHFKDDNHHESNTTNDTAKAATKNVFLDKPDVRDEDRTWSAGAEGAIALPWNLSLCPGFAGNYREAVRADNLLNPSGYNYSIASFPLGDATTWDGQMTLRWSPVADQQLRGSVSYRSHFPTIKDRYSYKLGSAIPNPDLQAEHSLQVEVGWTGKPLPWLSVDASLWEAWISDAIVTVTKVGPAGESQSRNAGSVRAGGPEWLGSAGSDWALPAPEIAARAALPTPIPGLARLEVSGSYSYLVRRDENNPSFAFVDQPCHKMTGSVLMGPLADLDLVATLQASSSRPGTSDGRFVAAGFATVDLLARWRMGPATFEAGVENAADANYALSEGYPEEGRTGFVRARVELR
jgi:iron complex outermembrane receptor protein